MNRRAFFRSLPAALAGGVVGAGQVLAQPEPFFNETFARMVINARTSLDENPELGAYLDGVMRSDSIRLAQIKKYLAI